MKNPSVLLCDEPTGALDSSSSRDVLANCLVNTDFYVPRGVVIKKDANKLVLENPGYIRVRKPQMLKGGESDPRNKALMKMFSVIDIGERVGGKRFGHWEIRKSRDSGLAG